MRFLSSMTRFLLFAVVSLLALGVAVAGLLLGTAIAASLLVLAGIKGLRARRAVSARGREPRPAVRPRERLDVVDIEFREKRCQ